ncbi:hypothetical protein BHE74_00056692 [Ensete ventricosum]|uniref:Uncharacterized protein n=1 Tax=Ensete ventricosum TaxID=4639 RepID=A0A444DZI2_ENSVE|nr:hypothetical protein B296_00055385 [Ensete ventricosum]RWW03561.1 hypothetical protein GW17_00033279 [Ensete ventricosum]RWW38103.1 hypothetical protein BHE74_00056692 [Ensete ventricosum]
MDMDDYLGPRGLGGEAENEADEAAEDGDDHEEESEAAADITAPVRPQGQVVVADGHGARGSAGRGPAGGDIEPSGDLGGSALRKLGRGEEGRNPCEALLPVSAGCVAW